MKKPAIIIGKKHIILACLTLILGIAIYLNYSFTQSGKELSLTKSLSGKDNSTQVAAGVNSVKDSGENYGDASLVNGTPAELNNLASEDYFAQARLDKAAKREEAVTTLQAMLGGGDLSEEEIAVMKSDAIQMASLVDTESTVESLVKSQGYEDCVVYLDGQTANVVVKSSGLEPAQAAQIKDILLSKVQVANENITIFEVK